MLLHRQAPSPMPGPSRSSSSRHHQTTTAAGAATAADAAGAAGAADADTDSETNADADLSLGSALGLGLDLDLLDLDPALLEAVRYDDLDEYTHGPAHRRRGPVGPGGGASPGPPSHDGAGSEPRTPPRISSPSIPSPLSLHHLGIAPLSPLSPLRRQLSSPLWGGFHDDGPAGEVFTDGHPGVGEEEEEEEEGVEVDDDRRDVLIQRLNDLAQRLARGGDPGDEGISALHAQVDDMERLLPPRTSPAKRIKSHKPRPRSLHSRAQSEDQHDAFWGSPSPSLFRSRIIEDLSASGSPALRQKEPSKPADEMSGTSVRDAVRIASEAEKLNGELAVLVANFKARQEETEHIHELLIARAEAAAERIAFLQGRVKDLEEELNENDSELSFLRLGLKAIEIQCPPDLDPELVQSINNWKMDWAKLKNRRNQRRISEITRSLTASPAMSNTQ